jgi:general secretion pathway protein B
MPAAPPVNAGAQPAARPIPAKVASPVAAPTRPQSQSQPQAAPVSSPGAPQQPTPVATGLPPDAPKIAITGGVYSSNPAQRMLIVNGQVFNEGSEVAPGISVTEIKPKSAVLTFRGNRYSVGF